MALCSVCHLSVSVWTGKCRGEFIKRRVCSLLSAGPGTRQFPDTMHFDEKVDQAPRVAGYQTRSGYLNTLGKLAV